MRIASSVTLGFLFFVFSLLLFPLAFTSAHEVYVLDEQTITQALATESANPFSAYSGNKSEFLFWGLISIVVFSTILFVSIFHLFERQMNPLLFFLKRIAHPLVRLTVGATLIVFGWYGVLYGPELPLVNVFGPVADMLQALLILLGIAVVTGLYTRTVASIAILIYMYAFSVTGWYVFSYVNHLGAYLFLLVMGSGIWSFDVRWSKRNLLAEAQSFLERLRPLAFPILRMGFGLAIMLAAVYAKFFHSELTLQVVYHYELTRYLPFEPLFVVLGAFIIEFLAGLMMFLGVAVRWTALFLAFWLTMGHIFTVEAWWVHLILYGLALAIFCHGYDRWSLEGRFLRRDGREPVL